MNLIHNDIGNNYIESIDNSISKELKDGLMNKIYYLNTPKGINLEKSLLLISNNNRDTNNKQPSNNANEKKDIDININNINYQQNQISNSNIIFNVSYSKDNQFSKELPTIKKEEISDIKPKQNNINKEIKTKKRIQINEDKNIYYHYQKDSSLADTYQIYNPKEENLEVKKGLRDLTDYMKMIKENPTPKPCIKIFNEKEIKMNEKYLLAENLKEEDIIPDLYEEEDEDIKSLSQSLVRSIDKWFGHSLNDKFSVNESNLSENINDNSNNTGKNLINQLQNMIMEDINEVNEDKMEEMSYEVENENVDDNNENEEDDNYNDNVNDSDDNNNNDDN
jgi:hypothetical protein